jgi:hypothetical protein
MTSQDDIEANTVPVRRLPAYAPRDAVLIALTLATILIGIFPGPVINFIHTMGAGQ